MSLLKFTILLTLSKLSLAVIVRPVYDPFPTAMPPSSYTTQPPYNAAPPAANNPPPPIPEESAPEPESMPSPSAQPSPSAVPVAQPDVQISLPGGTSSSASGDQAIAVGADGDAGAVGASGTTSALGVAAPNGALGFAFGGLTGTGPGASPAANSLNIFGN